MVVVWSSFWNICTSASYNSKALFISIYLYIATWQSKMTVNYGRESCPEDYGKSIMYREMGIEELLLLCEFKNLKVFQKEHFRRTRNFKVCACRSILPINTLGILGGQVYMALEFSWPWWMIFEILRRASDRETNTAQSCTVRWESIIGGHTGGEEKGEDGSEGNMMKAKCICRYCEDSQQQGHSSFCGVLVHEAQLIHRREQFSQDMVPPTWSSPHSSVLPFHLWSRSTSWRHDCDDWTGTHAIASATILKTESLHQGLETPLLCFAMDTADLQQGWESSFLKVTWRATWRQL